MSLTSADFEANVALLYCTEPPNGQGRTAHAGGRHLVRRDPARTVASYGEHFQGSGVQVLCGRFVVRPTFMAVFVAEGPKLRQRVLGAMSATPPLCGECALAYLTQTSPGKGDELVEQARTRHEEAAAAAAEQAKAERERALQRHNTPRKALHPQIPTSPGAGHDAYAWKAGRRIHVASPKGSAWNSLCA